MAWARWTGTTLFGLLLSTTQALPTTDTQSLSNLLPASDSKVTDLPDMRFCVNGIPPPNEPDCTEFKAPYYCAGPGRLIIASGQRCFTRHPTAGCLADCIANANTPDIEYFPLQIIMK